MVNVEGDGNCLFRAISLGLYGTQDHHHAIRVRTVDYVIEHWDRYEDPIKGEYERWHIVSQDDYRQYMSRSEPGNATYGGDIEINAAALAYNINIAVHLDTLSEPLETVGNSSVTIHLLYHAIRVEGEIDSGHYDFLQSTEQNLSQAINVNSFGPAQTEKSSMAQNEHCVNYREIEKQRDMIAKREKREQIEFRQSEKQRDLTAKQNKRADPAYRQTESQRDMNAKKTMRADDVYKQTENKRNRTSMKLRRCDDEYRQTERQRNVIAKKTKRSDDVYKQTENNRNRESKKLRRCDDEYRQTERQRDVNAKKTKRSDDVYKQTETTEIEIEEIKTV
ncbi:OTU domain-containing protein 3-like [Ptychodera flava]|uniref:OTU domain-containing protein 3-like n=1 Tax=Ptychodera flava TaxID=63121 RepID=UPI00396A65D9